MLMSREIRVLHLEPTDVCQAACPACARETDPEFDRDANHHLSIAQIKAHIDDQGIANLHKMFMCGNYGDPAAGRHTLEIYRHFRDINPQITLGMNTNGAVRNADWWQMLGQTLHQQQDYVVFSIDGLADTNHIYRRHVDWSKLMQNVEAYIKTGASAHWDMLVYRHNEHQVDACERLARSLGFTWFRAKISRRPLVSGLQIPLTWAAPVQHTAPIRCHVLQEQSMYIDAQGRRSPCCWLGSRQSGFVQDLSEVEHTWHTDSPNATCLASCGQNSAGSNFQSQWRREVQLC